MLSQPRFSVSINGEQRCVAGIDGQGVLMVVVVAHVLAGDDDRDEMLSIIHAAARVDVGCRGDSGHMNWGSFKLFVGDEMSMRIGDGGPFDTPSPQVIPPLGTDGEILADIAATRARLLQVGNMKPARFRVLVNEQQHCIAGIKFGVLTCGLTWVHYGTQGPRDRSDDGLPKLHIGGLEYNSDVRWTDRYCVEGEEITVKVLGPGDFDPPSHPRPHLPRPHRRRH